MILTHNIQPARRALYRELRVDYRHEVNRLISCLSLLPSNRSLVQHIVINGDAAHVPRIISLIQSLPSLRRVTFFDFELDLESDHQRDLCRSVAGPSLAHLSLQVLPNEFMTQVLKSAAPYLYSLRIYRVALSVSKGWAEDADWSFPHLENLELEFTGNISQEVFRQLVVRNSRNLRQFRLLEDGPKCPLTYDEMLWQDCNFDNLEMLHLDYFSMNVVQLILQRCTKNSLKRLTILALLRSTEGDHQNIDPPFQFSNEEEGDEVLYLSFLSTFPASIEYLKIHLAHTVGLVAPLCYMFSRKPDWLPRLKRNPRIVFRFYGNEETLALRETALKSAKARNLYMTRKDEMFFFVGPEIFHFHAMRSKAIGADEAS